MRITLKNAVNKLEDFATNHIGIEDFQYNAITKNFAQDFTYPLMFVELGDAPIGLGSVKLNMNIYFLDRLQSDGSNLLQVLSDMLKLCTDFFTKYQDNYDAYSFIVTTDMTATPIMFEFADNVAGYKMPVTIQVYFDANENNISM